MKHLIHFFSIIALLFLALVAHARDYERVPEGKVENDKHFVQTEDGATVRVTRLANPGKPILIMMPGLGAQGLSLEMPAERAFLGEIDNEDEIAEERERKGLKPETPNEKQARLDANKYDVWVCDWRGSVDLPAKYGDGYSKNGRNGMNEILKYELPAILRYVYSQASAEQKAEGIRLFGHSMGGMMIAKMGSDKKLKLEFDPLIKSRTLLQSPLDLKAVSKTMRWAAHVALPLLRELRANGVTSIKSHSDLLKLLKEAKARGGIRGKLLAPAIEEVAIQLTKLVLSPAHTGRRGIRKMFFKKSAVRIHIDLLEDFAKTIVEHDGEFLDENGNPHIVPENMGDVPTQIVRTNLDSLAPWEKAWEYFKRIPGRLKQILNVFEMNHVDSVLFDKPEVDFLPMLFEFTKRPAEQATNYPERTFKPYCEGLLARAWMTVRHKARLRGL